MLLPNITRFALITSVIFSANSLMNNNRSMFLFYSNPFASKWEEEQKIVTQLNFELKLSIDYIRGVDRISLTGGQVSGRGGWSFTEEELHEVMVVYSGVGLEVVSGIEFQFFPDGGLILPGGGAPYPLQCHPRTILKQKNSDMKFQNEHFRTDFAY